MNLKKIKDDFIKLKIEKPLYIIKMHELHKRLFEYSEFIKDTDISNIEILDDRVIMTMRSTGVRFLCDPRDERIAPIEILNFSCYEKEEFDMMLRLIKDGYTCFDIGANIGWFSMNMAISKKKLRIYAFEPIPKTYDYLRSNIALNGINEVKTFNHGFSDVEGDVVFYYYPEGSGNASLANLSSIHSTENIVGKVKRMDEFVRENDIKRLDYLKCDVEGAELLVFKGGVETLKSMKPIVFAEMLRKWAASFGYHPNEIVNFFQSIGYCCYVGKNGKLRKFEGMDVNTAETNFYFLHTEKHNAQIEDLSR